MSAPLSLDRHAAASGSWLPSAAQRHARGLLVAYLLASLAGLVLPTPDMQVQLTLLVIGVIVIALPHGAVDPWLAGSTTRSEEAAWIRFGSRYLTLALVVLAAWAISPTATLVAFFAVSAWHFGRTERPDAPLDDARELAALAIQGSTPILAPLAFRPAEAEALLGLVLGSDVTGALSQGLPALALAVWAVGAAVWTICLIVRAARVQRGASAIELGRWLGLVATCAALPVLLAFGVFFCLDHSLRHALRVAAAFDPDRAGRALVLYARRALPFTGLTVALAWIAWALGVGAFASESLVRVVFIGLAALTLPHVALGLPPIRRARHATSTL